jgi:hypothetical protein
MAGRRRKRRRKEPEEIDESESDILSGVGFTVLLIVFGLVAGVLYYLYAAETDNPNVNKFTEPEVTNPTIYHKPTGSGTTWKSEERVRAYLEEIFGVAFPTTRKIEWLKNDRTGRALEYDGYCPSLRIPFEHNGAQHVREEFGMSSLDLANQKYRDARKDMLTMEYLGTPIIRTGYRINEYDDIVYDRDLRAAVRREINNKYPQYSYLLA